MDLELQGKVALIIGGALIFGRNHNEAADMVARITVLGQHADSFHDEMTDEERVRAAVGRVAVKSEPSGYQLHSIHWLSRSCLHTCLVPNEASPQTSRNVGLQKFDSFALNFGIQGL
jgi:hypothetical protein